MEIHQLSAQYQREQDRILLRFNTTSREELRLWLTRLLLKSWWPLLRAEVPTEAAAAPAPDAAAPPVMPERQARPVPRPGPQADFSKPFRADYVTLPLGETPLLVTEVSQQRRGERLAISFVERLDPQASKPRAIDIDFEPMLQQGLRQLLAQTLAQTEWDLPDATAPARADEAGADEAQVGEALPTPRPPYLH